MAKVVKYEVAAKIVKKDQSVELRRIFRKLKNARDFVSETIKGLECTPFTEKEGELVRECKGPNVSANVRIIKHALKRYEVTVKSPNGEEKVIAVTLSEALKVVQEKAKQQGFECNEPKLENGVRTIECSKGDAKMTAEIRVQKGSLPKDELFARKKSKQTNTQKSK